MKPNSEIVPDPEGDIRLETTFVLSGNSFPVKEKLKELGCFWDYKRNIWLAPNRELAQKAQDLIYANEQKNARIYTKSGLARTARRTGARKHGRMS